MKPTDLSSPVVVDVGGAWDGGILAAKLEGRLAMGDTQREDRGSEYGDEARVVGGGGVLLSRTKRFNHRTLNLASAGLTLRMVVKPALVRRWLTMSGLRTASNSTERQGSARMT